MIASDHGWQLPQPSQRIVVVRALQLGDLLVAVPAFRALRRRFPAAEITLIGLPWAESFVQRFHHYIDRFVAFPGYPDMPEIDYEPARTTQFLAEQRGYGYDLAIQMHGSGGVSNPFTLALGARVMVGYTRYGPHPLAPVSPAPLPVGRFLRRKLSPSLRMERGDHDLSSVTFHCIDSERNSDVAPLSIRENGEGLGVGPVLAPYPDDLPEIMRNLRLVKLLGADQLDPALEFPLSAADHAEAAVLWRELPAGAGPVIGIHAGARPPARRWSAASFAAVADALAQQVGARIVLTGSVDERDTVRAVRAQLHAPALDLVGRTSLGGLAALLRRLDLFISNDTGPAHLAIGVDAPSITLFGPADYRRWAPLDQTRHPALRHPAPCSPCGYWECPIDHRCLVGITPDAVIKQAMTLLARGGIASCAG